MASVFTRIINREIPAFVVAEDGAHIAFLDITPVAHGHVLVVPKAEVDYIFNLSTDALSSLMAFAQVVAKGIEKVVPCKRIGLAVIGLEVPHTHIHLVPLSTVEDINFAKPKMVVSQESLAQVAEAIRTSLASV